MQKFSNASFTSSVTYSGPHPPIMIWLIHSITAEADAVTVFYDYQKPGGDLTVAQLFRFAGPKISEILLVFDAPKEPMP